jgi:hypothetical protein
MWHGPYIVSRVLEKGAYELVDYGGVPLSEPRNGFVLEEVLCMSHLCMSTCILCIILSVCYFSFAFDVIWSLPLRDVVFDCQMSEYLLPYIGFADDASHSTRNLASAAWAIYAPTNKLISL